MAEKKLPFCGNDKSLLQNLNCKILDALITKQNEVARSTVGDVNHPQNPRTKIRTQTSYIIKKQDQRSTSHADRLQNIPTQDQRSTSHADRLQNIPIQYQRPKIIKTGKHPAFRITISTINTDQNMNR